VEGYSANLEHRSSQRWYDHSPLHSCRLALDRRQVCPLQLDLGQADVPAQGLRRGQSPRPPLENLMALCGLRPILLTSSVRIPEEG